MKTTIRTLVLVLLFSPIISMYAQDEVVRNHPKYYQDGDCWMQALVPFNFEERIQRYEEEGSRPAFSLFAFFVEGDTIIDHKEYKCIHAKSWTYDGESAYGHEPNVLAENPQDRNVLFMREDADGKQWRRLAYLDDEGLLFDFSKPFEKNQILRYCMHDHLSEVLDYNLIEKHKIHATPLVRSPKGVEVWRSDEEAPRGYLYYNLKVSDVTSVELSNGEQVPLANGHIAFGWGDICIGDLWHQFLPDEESREGRFLCRVHQGQVIFQDQENMKVISNLIDTDVLSLLDKNKDDYHPFIEEGKVWTVSFKYPDTTIYCSFGNDTIIDGHACKEFLCSRLNLFTGKGGNRRVWMYEEDRRVWYFWEGEETFKLLYDFGAELYSEFTASRMGYQEVVCTVDYIGTDRALGGLRYLVLHDEASYLSEGMIEWIRQLDYFPIWNGTVYRWYEGIGTLLCPVMNCMSGLVGPECYLIKVEVGDKVLFDRGKWSTAIRDVNTLNSKRSTLNNIFDLSGRRVSVSSASSVSSVLPRGVYIKDGKKVVVK